MLSFTPVSGKEEGKRRKECEGSREAATMLSTQRLLSVPSSPSPELPESFQNCQVAEDEAPHLHQATPPPFKHHCRSEGNRKGDRAGKAASKILGSPGCR